MKLDVLDITPEQKQFLMDWFALSKMEEAENPALYKRVHDLVDQIPPERRGRVAFGHEIIRPFVEEYRKMKAGKT